MNDLPFDILDELLHIQILRTYLLLCWQGMPVVRIPLNLWLRCQRKKLPEVMPVSLYKTSFALHLPFSFALHLKS